MDLIWLIIFSSLQTISDIFDIKNLNVTTELYFHKELNKELSRQLSKTQGNKFIWRFSENEKEICKSYFEVNDN